MKRLLALGMLLSAFVARPADACIREMAVHDVGPNPAAEVASTDTLLENGKSNASVIATLAKSFPALKSAPADPGQPLRNHALRNAALAVARSKGAVNGMGFKASETTTNLAWAAATMRALFALRPNDASLEADVAEVLAKSGSTKDEAFTRLTALAEKDLIGSPQALAELTRLRKDRGDTDGAKASFEKCRSMTTPAQASVCGESPVAKPVPAKPSAATAPRTPSRS